jgi:hypothetical protein
MKLLSAKVNIPESYFGIEFTNVSLYFYVEEGFPLIRLLVNDVRLGVDRPIQIDCSLFPEEDEKYSEDNILFGVKEVYPEFFVSN